jgi:hypothetical protein
MESNFNNRDFEHYVKSNADQYRMIPSEKVWKSINNTLHSRRKWYGIGLSLLLVSTAISVTWVMLSYPTSKKQEAGLAQNTITSPIAAKNADQSSSETGSGKARNLSFNNNPKENNSSVPGILFNDPALSTAIDGRETSQQIDMLPEAPALGLQVNKAGILIAEKTEPTAPATIDNIPAVSGINDTEAGKDILKNDPLKSPGSSTVRSNLVFYPLTIESVTNSYKAKKLVKKLVWELYFTPTISYRKLGVNKSFDGSVSPFSASNYPFANSRDVNSEVTHKPDMGLELGISTGYPLSKHLRLIGGLQFNINRYDIKAFAYYGEQATINLNGVTDPLTPWTYYRNHDGYKSDWLKNYYFSVSAPVGAELRVLGNDRTYFGVAGTVQPTYIVKDRAFLISTDYKNYVEVPRLIRHVNVNTSFETFISYTSRTNKTRWQIGPQVRYQVLSSYKNPYPVKENLFDFGLKIGVSTNR